VRRELAFDRLVDRQINDMEVLAERRLRRRQSWVSACGGGGGGGGGGGIVDGRSVGAGAGAGAGACETGEDPFLKLAKKLRCLSEMLKSELDNAYAADCLSKAVDPAPMTMTDAIQTIMHDLEGNWWLGATDWSPFDTMFFTGSLY
jgi:hypothetical protein